MRLVGMQVGFVCFKSCFVQVIILFYQFIQLILNICQAFIRELIFIHNDSSFLQMLEVFPFLRKQKNKCFTSCVESSAGSSHSMNIISCFVGRIKLHYPINLRNIESSSGYIGAQKNSFLGIGELIECVGSFTLLLSTMDIHDRHINIIQEITVEFD